MRIRLIVVVMLACQIALFLQAFSGLTWWASKLRQLFEQQEWKRMANALFSMRRIERRAKF